MTLAFLSNVKDSVYIMSKMPLLSCFEPFCSEKGQGGAGQGAWQLQQLLLLQALQ